MRAVALIALLTAGPSLAQEAARHHEVVGGDAARGRALIAAYGCGVCHTVPGIRGARGTVGPDLTRFGSRDLIAGLVPNRPDDLMLWLQNPQGISPGSGMPDMGITPAEAADIATYLLTMTDGDRSIWSGALELARTLLRGPG